MTQGLFAALNGINKTHVYGSKTFLVYVANLQQIYAVLKPQMENKKVSLIRTIGVMSVNHGEGQHGH